VLGVWGFQVLGAFCHRQGAGPLQPGPVRPLLQGRQSLPRGVWGQGLILLAQGPLPPKPQAHPKEPLHAPAPPPAPPPIYTPPHPHNTSPDPCWPLTARHRGLRGAFGGGRSLLGRGGWCGRKGRFPFANVFGGLCSRGVWWAGVIHHDCATHTSRPDAGRAPTGPRPHSTSPPAVSSRFFESSKPGPNVSKMAPSSKKRFKVVESPHPLPANPPSSPTPASSAARPWS
jgi:hypothetical protein